MHPEHEEKKKINIETMAKIKRWNSLYYIELLIVNIIGMWVVRERNMKHSRWKIFYGILLWCIVRGRIEKRSKENLPFEWCTKRWMSVDVVVMTDNHHISFHTHKMCVNRNEVKLIQSKLCLIRSIVDKSTVSEVLCLDRCVLQSRAQFWIGWWSIKQLFIWCVMKRCDGVINHCANETTYILLTKFLCAI